jgi:hypothetical protein
VTKSGCGSAAPKLARALDLAIDLAKEEAAAGA